MTKTYKYDAFGVEKNIDENDANAFRYCGEYYDTETATIYLRARYYNPSTGRFTQRDSFAGKNEEPLSLNLYTYCANNPIKYVDSNGHSFWDYIFNPMKVYAPCVTDKNSYVIYDDGDKNNKKQAEIIMEQYEEEYGGMCIAYPVSSAEEFVSTWESLDDSNGINAIQVISHGHVNNNKESADYGIGYLLFNDGTKLYSSSFDGLTSGNRSIDNIYSKNVNSIYFSACNTANPDFNTNIMDAFFDKNTSAKSVTGWDGGVTFRFHQRGLRSILSGNFQWTVNKDVPSDNQDTFNFFKDPNDKRKEGPRTKTRK